MIPSVEIPTPASWTRFAWAGRVDPGDKLAPIWVDSRPANVTASITSVPAGARVRFQHSPDGKRGWTDLDSKPVAFFKEKPGDTVEWRGLTGYLRPVLETKNSGTIAINVTVQPQDQRSMTGAVA